MTKIKVLLFFVSILASIILFAACDSCEHEYETTSMGADCEHEVINSKICSKCGDRTDTRVPPSGHDFKEKTVSATCTSEGYTEYTCHCGHSYKGDFVSAIGHDYREIVTPPTCTDGGYTLYVCRKCDHTYKDKLISANGHELTSKIIAPDCDSEGYAVYSCQKCDYSFNSDYCKPEGHSFVSKIVAPGCESEGYTEYSCQSCDLSFNSEFVKPTGHVFSETVISTVSCTEQGETVYTCDCGYSYSKIEAPLGHDFEKKVTSPTVSDMGFTEFFCKCGFNYIGNYRFYSDILDNAYAGNDKVVAKGIDISKWNHTVDADGNYEPIDWYALKDAGVDYVILKIGSTPRDGGLSGGLEPTFLMDYEGAKAAGIDVGVYYFTYANNVKEIKQDAETILSWLNGKSFEYPIYLDVEDVPKEDYYPSRIASPILTEMCLSFFSELQKHGYYTGLYVNNEFLFNILQTENMIDLFEIWYARYPSYDAVEWNGETMNETVWNTQKYGEHLGMWQFSRLGKLAPIVGDVDFNYAYKDYPALIAKNGFNGLIPEESEPSLPDSETELIIDSETSLETESVEETETLFEIDSTEFEDLESTENK